jgi:hypothetical protein
MDDAATNMVKRGKYQEQPEQISSEEAIILLFYKKSILLITIFLMIQIMLAS